MAKMIFVSAEYDIVRGHPSRYTVSQQARVFYNRRKDYTVTFRDYSAGYGAGFFRLSDWQKPAMLLYPWLR
jgi:hypothetical protein